MQNYIKIKQLKEILPISYKLKQTPFLWGNPGIGKSQAVAQFAAENNLILLDIRLALKDPTDLQGLPTFMDTPDGKKTTWTIPDFLPQNPDWKGVIFLDEFNLAQPAVMSACYQLINERKINNYNLPEGAFIVAAGNPSDFSGNVTELPQALKNRFNHFYIEPDLDEWISWAISQNISLDVQTFLKTQRPELFFDEKAFENEANEFATPRNWEKISNLLNLNLSDEVLRDYISSLIGLGATAHFINYLNDKNKYQNPEEIYIGRKPFSADDINSYYGTLIAAINNIAKSSKDEDTKKQYVSNLINQIDLLKSNEWKVFSASLLTHTEGIKKLISAKDLMKILK